MNQDMKLATITLPFELWRLLLQPHLTNSTEAMIAKDAREALQLQLTRLSWHCNCDDPTWKVEPSISVPNTFRLIITCTCQTVLAEIDGLEGPTLVRIGPRGAFQPDNFNA